MLDVQGVVPKLVPKVGEDRKVPSTRTTILTLNGRLDSIYGIPGLRRRKEFFLADRQPYPTNPMLCLAHSSQRMYITCPWVYAPMPKARE
jgi:hypothetical protein